MKVSEEIKWLQECRKSAQEVVDKITLRVTELQESVDKNKIGYSTKEKEV